MSIKNDLLSALLDSKDYISGESLSKKLFCSRNAVWKAVNALRAEGYEIEARSARGYRLNTERLPLSAAAINGFLGESSNGLDITVLDTVASTNDYVKELAAKGAPEGTVVIASHQTKGKGRLGRSFYSPGGSGLYLSILLRPKLSLSECLLITTSAAVAVADAIDRATGKQAMIKWVNDVFLNGKKICGILTEASTDIEVGGLSWAVVGIGINLTEPDGGFPDEIKDIAGAVFDRSENVSAAEIAAALIKRFFELYGGISDRSFLESYRKRSILLGKKVRVIRGGEQIPAQALEIDRDCRLFVKYDTGETEWLSSGEVSVKL